MHDNRETSCLLELVAVRYGVRALDKIGARACVLGSGSTPLVPTAALDKAAVNIP